MGRLLLAAFPAALPPLVSIPNRCWLRMSDRHIGSWDGEPNDTVARLSAPPQLPIEGGSWPPGRLMRHRAQDAAEARVSGGLVRLDLGRALIQKRRPFPARGGWGGEDLRHPASANCARMWGAGSGTGADG